MKKLLTGLLLLASVGASAESIRLHSIREGFGIVTPTFAVNDELGRAWVNINVEEDWDDEDSSDYDVRVKVKGLTYNKTTSEIIYTTETETVVCARYETRGRGIFRRENMRKTGNCTFVESTVTKDVDDGYYITRRTYSTTTLEIN